MNNSEQKPDLTLIKFTVMDYYPFKEIITSIADLEEIIKQVRNYRGQLEFTAGKKVTELYRGQGRDCWKLIPKIARSFTDSENIKKIEKEIVNDFRKELNKKELTQYVQEGFYPEEFHSDWLILQQAQHYELPTRFMDWTGMWEVALCFVTADELDDKYDGQFWIYLVPDENWVSDNGDNQYLGKDPFEYDRTIFLNSVTLGSSDHLIKIAQRRKLRQMGRFCVQTHYSVTKPLEEQIQHQPHLHKVIIPSVLKKNIRNELASIGITKDSLYISEPEHKKAIKKIEAIVSKLIKKYRC